MDRIRVLRADAAKEIMHAQAAVTESEHPARLRVRGPAAVILFEPKFDRNVRLVGNIE
jgi:hypothetical protein